ncbi:D-alanyl-D-alanine carboxypeptidase/D-alanyl-D-alanine-endopeptidase [Bifidobacterium sp. 82T24]|uniref:D-alanyl-D-alanine carboxypeptidase/D-alanyl-D-alanine endopeptidase n=1 Tax=Bifidobacterium pluvialisilvae TaxID=2834436 RepID=UPI001C599274|nr:D-alanyl-D-alanine carboxypeptidase/D-alanyl-D-alanine-endopeptidase [Bifidobacterium pluvialisilvae]MBW3088407.1 D-alanyl-D-alanine carboxypeptidase/D-alanyl-D-alanine-endopeptidase [Bifidobacterium pluvialisilvae]
MAARPSRRAARLQRRRVARRKWVVAASAVITVALGLGYAVADAYDIAPGPLSLEPARTVRFPQAASAVAAKPLVGAVGEGKGIDTAGATALVDKFAKAKGVGKDFSIIIADAQGKPVVERNQGVAREPASTMKTLTAFAATASLDMSSTLDTETYLDGDTLVLKGNGDMLLGEGTDDARHINGRAGVATLAQRTAKALKAKGVSTVSVAYDDSLFGSKRFPDTIAENNEGNDMLYAAPMSSMAIDEGRNWSGTTKPSDPDVESAFPTRFADSAAKTAETFTAQLKRQGITVNGGIAKGTAPSGKPIASVSSARLSEIMAFMLRNSDNTEAELFGRLTALKTGQDNSPEGAAAAVKAALEKAGIDTTGIRIADCSGLSAGSRLTATTLMQVQAKYIETGDTTAPASEGLAVSGLSGTAAKRNIARSAAGLVRLKTGTLGSVTSMTGNVSRTSGGTLVFAVIVNNPENMWEAILAVDDLVGHLPEL